MFRVLLNTKDFRCFYTFVAERFENYSEIINGGPNKLQKTKSRQPTGALFITKIILFLFVNTNVKMFLEKYFSIRSILKEYF